MLTETQLKNRKTAIGASDCATVLGLNPSMTPYELWLIKTGQIEQPDISHIPEVYWGNVHEEQIAAEYAKRMNCELIHSVETYFYPEYPFIICHPDRFVKGERKLLECKFSKFSSSKWGETGSTKVPLSYILQVQHQMLVTGYEQTDIAVLIGGYDFRIYHFARDEQIIKKILEELIKFWECVSRNIPPDCSNSRDVSLVYPVSNGNYKNADESIKLSLEKIKHIRMEQKKLEEERKKFERDLTLFIGESEGISEANKILATWKNTAKGHRVLRINEEKI